MVKSPQRIWIEADEECPYFYEAHELHDVEQDVIEYVRADLYAALEAQLAERAGVVNEDALRALAKSYDREDVARAIELSGNTGELIDRMAEAIRGDTTSDDTPWATLSEDRKEGWRGDAERALAVVKEYLTTEGYVILPKSEARLREAAREAVNCITHHAEDNENTRWVLSLLNAALKEGEE